MPARAVAFAGLAALAVAMGIGRFAFTPILPMMQDDAGLSIADGGWLASANYAGYLVTLERVFGEVRFSGSLTTTTTMVQLETFRFASPA